MKNIKLLIGAIPAVNRAGRKVVVRVSGNDRYRVTYGSLGAVIILMLWFYMAGPAILVGGKRHAEIESAAAKIGKPVASSSKRGIARRHEFTATGIFPFVLQLLSV